MNTLLLIGLLFYPYQNDRTYLSVEHIKNFYQLEKKPDAKILFLGNSVIAFGIRPILLDKAYSLALPSSTSVNIWLELDRFLKVASAPRCLVYSTSYINEHFQAGFLEKHIGAQLYDQEEINSIFVEAKNQNLEPLASLSRFEFWKKIFWAKYLNFSVYTQVQFKKWIAPFIFENSDFAKKRIKTIQEQGFLDSESFGKNLFGERQNYLLKPFEAFPMDDYFFTKILNKTEENGIKFIFIEMPINNETNDQRITSFVEAQLHHVQNLTKKYNHVKILQIPFEPDKSYFFDANHLNTRGATEFTKILKTYLDKECE